ncbi:hypothetical protein SteCoe_33785 [Stentor coeruleus]|uniref:Fe2OG dioxygenase domain-containing protein n=1 Tax=Stentor coeruleus TaxID=5963 RepID=A0A1R2AW13_9CILI|nr:hypothetical protein SteCoe_33785 [Stentor coeruleus]
MAVLASSIKSFTKRLFSSKESFNHLLAPIKINDLKWYSESDIPAEIPLIDLKSMTQNEQISGFKQAFETSHCVYIKNHLISNKEMENLVNATRIFFNQSEEIKNKIVHPYKGIMRGYNGFGQEKSSNILHIKDEHQGDSHISYCWGPKDNVYPDIKFQKIWSNYYKKSLRLSKSIAELAIKSAGMENVIGWNNLKAGDHLLKIQEYIALGYKAKQNYRLFPHADFDFLTLLTQLPAENGFIGLQVKIGDKFINAPAVKGTIIINFGEAMQSLSGGKVKTVVHSVISPEEDKYNGSSRTSIPFFLQPHPKTKITKTEGSFYSDYYNEKSTWEYADFHSRLLGEFYKH